MNDDLVIRLWCQLAFRSNLNEEELKLRNRCAKRLLEIIGTPNGCRV